MTVKPCVCPDFVGESPAIVAVKEGIERVATSDARVLIVGEGGTGKEIIARTIHARSTRCHRPFVTVNCAGLHDDRLEEELFGGGDGAARRQGKLELAETGTIFLDEIAEMSPRVQSTLLRFLETGELPRNGANPLDVRVISSTARRLKELIARGTFREDLYYRLNVVHLAVPPLRERRSDIPLLIEHALRRFQGDNGCVVRGFTPEAAELLRGYAWPGNIRELRNVVEHIALTSRKEIVDINELPLEIRPERQAPTPEPGRSVADELYIRVVEGRESFWNTVYPLYMNREITRATVRDLVTKGLVEARGNYRIVARLFNMPPGEYKTFLNFLRKHECQVPFREYR